MKHTTWNFTWTLAAAACLATSALAQEHPPRGPQSQDERRPSPRSDHAAPAPQHGDLDPQQAEKIRKADPNFHQDMRILDRQLKIARLELANVVESRDADEAQIRKGFEKVGEAQMALQKRVAQHVLAIRPHLTAEQRLRFLEMLSRRLHGSADRDPRPDHAEPPHGDQRRAHDRPQGPGHHDGGGYGPPHLGGTYGPPSHTGRPGSSHHSPSQHGRHFGPPPHHSGHFPPPHPPNHGQRR